MKQAKREVIEQTVMAFLKDRPAPTPRPSRAKAAPAPRSGLPKISDVALAMAARPQTRREVPGKRGENTPFVVYRPPEFVVPKEQMIAMDEGLGPQVAWAAQTYYNGGYFEGVQFLGYPQLAALAQRPEYRMIVETIATECTRKWIKLTSSTDNEEKKTREQKLGEEAAAEAGSASRQDQETAAQQKRINMIEKEFDRLKLRSHMRRIIEQDGFFGRAHLYLDTGDTDNREELKTPIGDGMNAFTKRKLKKGKLERLKTVEAVWCYPSGYNSNDPLKVGWYNPACWYVQGKEIHVSRLIPFVGREVPDLLKPAYSFGGLSMTQMAEPYVQNWLNTRSAVGDILQNFSKRGLKANLAALLQDGGGEMIKRAQLLNLLATNQGMMLIDKDTEEFFEINTPLGTLDALQAQSQEHMASVSRIPLVKLLGIQPAGLNASSEGELVTFEDMIHAYQEKLLRDPLTRILHFVQMSLFGEVDPTIGFDFMALREMNDKERSEIRKMDAETDSILVNDVAAISPEEVRRRVANDDEMPYGALDPADVPEPPVDQTADGENGGEGDNEGGDGGDEPDDPFGGASDEFASEDHPHAPGGSSKGGQFVSTGGAGGGSSEPAEKPEAGKPKKSAFGGLWKTQPQFTPSQNVVMNINNVLGKPTNAGSSYRQMLAHLIKEWPKADVPGDIWQKLENTHGGVAVALKAKLGEAFALANEKALKAAVNAPNDAEAKKFSDIADKAKAKASKLGVEAPEAQSPATPAAPAAPKPTEAEISKAKSSYPLGKHILPHVEEADLKKFNDKFANENAPKTEEQAVEKIAAFNALKQKNAEAEGAAKAKASKAAAAQKAKDEALAKAAAEKNKQIIKELGLTDSEAYGFQALVEMMGGNQSDVISSFKSYEAQAKQYGYPITGFQAALIRNYTDGGYNAINKNLRKGSWTEAQHVYVKMVNKALLSMPRYEGQVSRGADLPHDVQQSYVVGNIVEERAFTSTSPSNPFSGNTKYRIKAIGKRGAHIQKLSNHAGENEVLFAARTFFKVTKIEGKPGGSMTVHMEEMED